MFSFIKKIFIGLLGFTGSLGRMPNASNLTTCI